MSYLSLILCFFPASTQPGLSYITSNHNKVIFLSTSYVARYCSKDLYYFTQYLQPTFDIGYHYYYYSLHSTDEDTDTLKL